MAAKEALPGKGGAAAAMPMWQRDIEVNSGMLTGSDS